MPTPREAAAILRARFPGLVPEAPDDDRSVAYGDPTGALALAHLRDDEAGQLRERLIQQESAALIPTDGYVQGDPGRRMRSNAVAASNAIETRKRLGDVTADAAADPFTGAAEQARTKGIQTTLDAAATTMRPEVDDAARAVATRNAFGDFLKSKGIRMGVHEADASPAALEAATVPFKAASSPAAIEAATVPSYVQNTDVARHLRDEAADRERLRLDEATGRKGVEKMQPELTPGQMKAEPGTGEFTIGGYSLPPNMKPLGQEAERNLRAIEQVVPMIKDLDAMLDPSRNEITNAVGNRAAWALYSGLGMKPENIPGISPQTQQRMQLASMIEIAGAAPFLAGTRAYRYLKEVQKHLTNPLATDAFLAKQTAELRRIYPQIRDAILRAHYQPGATLDFGDIPDTAGAAPDAPDAAGDRVIGPNGETGTVPPGTALPPGWRKQ